ncbi:MAG TPA: four helix bundle protein [Nitrospira sp.]|nr:four helix bundle protein [Nitrospira sp.]
MKQSIVKDKSYSFALKVVQLARTLRQQQEFELSKQLLRAGTSIGANVEEALAGVSKRDFVAKMSIASKEARETHYWLRLVYDSKVLSSAFVAPILKDADELLRILTAIVKTTQRQNGSGKQPALVSPTKHSKLNTQHSRDLYA